MNFASLISDPHRRLYMLLEATFVHPLCDIRPTVDALLVRELMRYDLPAGHDSDDATNETEEEDCSQWMTVKSCTSEHPQHGPERMLRSQGMWITTGLLPQKLTLEFRLP